MGTLNNTVSYEEQQKLFNAAKDGNKTSFWKLFDLYKDDVFCKLPIPKRFYNAHCRDDLIHSAGVIACEDIGKAESLHSFPGWLYTVALHVLYKILEEIDRTAETWISLYDLFSYDDLPDNDPAKDVVRACCNKEGIENLHRCIHELSKEEQMIIKARYFLGLNDTKAAEFLRTSEYPEFRTINRKTFARRCDALVEQLRIRLIRRGNFCVPFMAFSSFLKLFGPPHSSIAEPTFAATILGGVKWLGAQIISPLLWFMALLICGTSSLKTMLHQTNDIPLRFWLIKRLFLGYCGVILIPIILILGYYLFYLFLPDTLSYRFKNDLSFTFAAGIMLMVFIIFSVLSFIQYTKVRSGKTEIKVAEINERKQSLFKTFLYTSLVTGTVILCFLCFFVLKLYRLWEPDPYTIHHKDVVDIAISILFYLGYHIFAVMTFWKMVAEVEVISPAILLEHGRKTAIWCFTVTCIGFSVISFAVQPLCNRTISHFEMIIMLLYGAWWSIVCIWNYRKGPRWLPVILSIILQYFLLVVASCF